MIVISAQHGDPRSTDTIWPLHRQLNKLFEEFVQDTHCESVDKFGIVFRVSGKVRDFGGEGPERLKRLRKDKEVTIDFVIPEERWRGVPEDEVRSYVASQVRVAFGQLIERVEEDKEPIDSGAVLGSFEKAMEQFES